MNYTFPGSNFEVGQTLVPAPCPTYTAPFTELTGLGGGIIIVPPRAGEKGFACGRNYSNQVVVVVKGSELSANRAGLGGGALAVESAADGGMRVQLLGSALARNSVDGDGGAVHVAGNVTATISNCTLASNAARGFGGALTARGCNLMNITRSAFTENWAKQLGGAAHVDSCRMLAVRQVWVTANADVSAGGLAVTNTNGDSSATAALILNSTFHGGVAVSDASNGMGYAGAMLIRGRVAALETDTRFDSKYAVSQGGAGGAVLVDSSECQGVGLLKHPVLCGQIRCPS